jgi:hypothetical protein
VESVNSAIVNNASSADLGTIQCTASVLVMKKALDAQASGAAQLIAALPQPALATSGTVGTKVNTFA